MFVGGGYMSVKRLFWIVLDSFGCGELPDACVYGDVGSDTLASCAASSKLDIPNMIKLGLGNIAGVTALKKAVAPEGAYGRMGELSKGKDTTTGHWELAGLVSQNPFPTYPGGFPQEVLERLERAWGRGILCNRPYSGTKVLYDYGRGHLETGKLIVYTSADSVLQVAAHEELVPVPQLYKYCEEARAIMCGKHAVGRIIARPFVGQWPDFTRTTNRHDYSLTPPAPTMLDALMDAGLATIGVGKIYDIFNGRAVSECNRTRSNTDGMEKTTEIAKRDFTGLCFVNLVDFDMLYGHRNDVDGYAAALTEFDRWLGGFLEGMGEEDALLITADHGCDPATPSTDHSREYVPLLLAGKHIKRGVDLGTRGTFADAAATCLDMFGVTADVAGDSFWKDIAE